MEAITKIIKEYKFDSKIGPSDYIPHLKDNKICFIEINGKQFGDIPFKLEAKLSVEDSPNSAGVMIDVIRLLKVAMDRKLSGYQNFSSYYFKHPMFQYEDNYCRDIVESFINNNSL
jgi:myo-inositol-1-phosphate synthase